jgi:hypothetical protein
VIETIEGGCSITAKDAIEAIRGAATALSGQWSAAWCEKLAAAASLLDCTADVLRPHAIQYADHPDDAIRRLAANVDTAYATMTIMLGSLAMQCEPSGATLASDAD